MKATETVEVYTCDACGKEVVDLGGDPPLGISGMALEVSRTGGWTADWWACRRSHIAAAVKNALDRRDD